jgi:6-phosphogluconolactonase (cycloisomerase 2 family)
MQKQFLFVGQRLAALMAGLCVFSSFAVGGSQPSYVMTNDDAAFVSGVTFYTVGTTGQLKLKGQVSTGAAGISGGYFPTSRLAALANATQQCVYASNAAGGNIVGIDINTLVMGGSASGSSTDSGAANGIGLALNGNYLYASFTSSNTIGTFQIQSGCSLTFVSDIAVAGLQGGFIDAMVVTGNTMVVTYGDGSIESFNVASGAPVSNGDEQNSTGYLVSQGSSYPTAVEITKDGHYAIFGDTSTSTLVEVSDMSSGKLAKTTVFSLGHGINSSNILLSPDETLLYISNTQGDEITAAAFNATTGTLTAGCTSGRLSGYSVSWSYLADLALQTNTGTGGTIYVAEYGSTSSIAVVQVGSSGGKCTLQEATGSPVSDPNSGGLLSIAAFPPRTF